MITTLHARPHVLPHLRDFKQTDAAHCLRGCMAIGLAFSTREKEKLLANHRCPASTGEDLWPAATIPFN